MPLQSSEDAAIIQRDMRERRLFRNVVQDGSRQNIETRLLNSRRIVTINSFFEDTKYLRACFEGLRTLLPAKRLTRSLRETFRDHFGVDRKYFLASYICLWMCAMRNFDRLSDKKFSQGRQTNRNQKKDVSSTPISKTHLAQLANLAASKGFHSKEIDTRISETCELILESAPMEAPEVSNNNDDISHNARHNRPHQRHLDQSLRHLFPEYVFQPIVESR